MTELVEEYYFPIRIKGIKEPLEIKYRGSIDRFNFERMRNAIKSFQRARLKEIHFGMIFAFSFTLMAWFLSGG